MSHTKPIGIILMLICTIFTALGQPFFKLGSNINYIGVIKTVFSQNLFETLSTLTTNPILRTGLLLFIGFVLYGIGAMFLITSLKYGELSVLYPIFAANYVWVAIITIIIFNEPTNILKWSGVFAIIIGISFIGVGSRRKLHKSDLESFGIISEVDAK